MNQPNSLVKMECCMEGEELISKLPDDILVGVLSLLAPKEVIRCGALSRRWTTLPKLIPMTLKFVRKEHQLTPAALNYFIHHVKQRPMCTSLTHLRLSHVNVTAEHIQHFLKCCPLLESLFLRHSDSLTSLKVDVPIRLKFLDVSHCINLQIFEICTPNLISFKYMQHPIRPLITSMPLKWAPQLNEMDVSGGFYEFLIDNFRPFSNFFARIETLSLGVVRTLSPQFRWPIGIPTLRNLKHLTVRAQVYDNSSLLRFCPWIEASPLLRRFVFEATGIRRGTRRKPVEPWMRPHQFLKEVEFVGFTGDVLETELVMYIVTNAVNLDKIVFDCRDPRFIGTYLEDTKTRERSFGQLGATKLQSKLSSAVEFVLIP